jgi:hypothetical protein
MHAHVSLLGMVLLPTIAGAVVLAFAPAWRRWFGDEGATLLAGRFALGATLLASFLLAAALYGISVRPDLPPGQPVAWARVGHTTALGLDLELDWLGRIVAAYALVVALAVQLAALADPRAGATALGRSALLLGMTLLLGMAGTAWAAVLAWQAAMLVAGACGGPGAVPEDMVRGTGTSGGGRGPEDAGAARRAVPEDMNQGTGASGHGPEDMAPATGASGHGREDMSSGWARAGDAGAWLAVLAVAVGAGDLGLELVGRGAMFAGSASLVATRLAGAPAAAVAAAGLAVAVLARAGGLARALRGEDPASRAAVHALAGGAGVVLLLRLHMVLALAPAVMAALALGGAGLAAWAGLAALRADGAAAAGRASQARVGLMLAAAGMGAWVPACGLLVAHGLASAALALAPGGASRTRWLAALALLGLLPTSAGLWAGEVGGAAWMYLGAWSPAMNVAAAGLVLVALVGLGGSLGQVVRDRSERTGATEVAALVAAGLAGLAVAAGVLDLPGATAGLRGWMGPEFGASWLLPGEYALGPRPPYSVGMARWGGAAVGLAAAWLGVVLAPRLRAWRAPRWPERPARLRGRGVARAVYEAVEAGVLRVLLAPGEVRAARAPGPPDLRRALLAALLGGWAVLGAVFCNPDVVEVGPTRVYPVDVGGLNPALIGSRRSGGAEVGAGGQDAEASAAQDAEGTRAPAATSPSVDGPRDMVEGAGRADGGEGGADGAGGGR